jgi:hypothetical protein
VWWCTPLKRKEAVDLFSNRLGKEKKIKKRKKIGGFSFSSMKNLDIRRSKGPIFDPSSET